MFQKLHLVLRLLLLITTLLVAAGSLALAIYSPFWRINVVNDKAATLSVNKFNLALGLFKLGVWKNGVKADNGNGVAPRYRIPGKIVIHFTDQKYTAETVTDSTTGKIVYSEEDVMPNGNNTLAIDIGINTSGGTDLSSLSTLINQRFWATLYRLTKYNSDLDVMEKNFNSWYTTQAVWLNETLKLNDK